MSRAVALVSLFSVAAIIESVRLSSLRDTDIWLHLRVGQWILANRTWPTTGLFSQTSNLPWRDFNWAADATIGLAYSVVGLSAIPALSMICRLALAGVTFLLAGGSPGNFWLPAALSALAQYLLYGLGPVGAGISAVLFGIELLVLLEVRRAGNLQRWRWLPLLFLIWANVDLGFVYGIGLLIMFLAASAIEQTRWASKTVQRVGSIRTALPLACLLATMISPYGYHAYPAFLAIQTSAANRYLPGYTAMTFHQPQDYLLLLLVMAAFLSLGLRHSRDTFLLPVLIGCTALAFSARGANWLAILGTLAVFGEGIMAKAAPVLEEEKSPRWGWLALPIGAALAISCLFWGVRVPREQNVLLSRVNGDFPVNACDYIRQHQMPAPLFNSYRWGSFLTWYLLEYPVAIDQRRGLYTDETETDYFKVMRVLMPFQGFAPMEQARTLLLDKQDVMAEALRTVPGFQVAYEDGISVVLLRQKPENP